MNTIDYIQLSKTVSHALRHEPQFYNLILDNEGWVLLSDLVSALSSKSLNVNESEIIKMIDLSEKKRHQVVGGRIRAFYGHSIEKKILKTPSEPPEILYHGTKQNSLDYIIEKGLLPMKRQYVHLSLDKRTSEIVGSRNNGKLVVLKVRAKEAFKNNINFYQEENGVWLSNPIPPTYIVKEWN